MDKKLILSALRDGEMRLDGQFIYGSNYTFLAICTFGDKELKAVYKPIQGEQPLWDFPIKTLGRREVAAYLVSEALGWKLVPPTVFRLEGAPMGPGSVQLFIEHDPNIHFFTFGKKKKRQFQKVMAFDLLINNADRKGGHFLLDPNGDLWLIDHGISFHKEDKLRTVLWDYAGQPIPQEILIDIRGMITSLSPQKGLFQSLQPHLLP
ncbi:MAG: SCO1664 family protein, partial [Chloroflexota bacterium]|nr:SCO1664 family protein [Chloroflexota bacterium]